MDAVLAGAVKQYIYSELDAITVNRSTEDSKLDVILVDRLLTSSKLDAVLIDRNTTVLNLDSILQKTSEKTSKMDAVLTIPGFGWEGKICGVTTFKKIAGVKKDKIRYIAKVSS